MPVRYGVVCDGCRTLHLIPEKGGIRAAFTMTAGWEDSRRYAFQPGLKFPTWSPMKPFSTATPTLTIAALPRKSHEDSSSHATGAGQWVIGGSSSTRPQLECDRPSPKGAGNVRRPWLPERLKPHAGEGVGRHERSPIRE